MSGVERLFSEAPEPTVVNCDWCGAVATVCSMAERSVGGTPARIGFCEQHHAQLVSAPGQAADGDERAAYERRRAARDAELRQQRNEWRQRKAARQAEARARLTDHGAAPRRPARGSSTAGDPSAARPDDSEASCPQDSEELVAAILKGERPVSAVQVVDPRLEDPSRRLERLQEALWPLVRLAEECGIYVDCNPSQTHSVLVAGEVPVQALFRARDLLKRESER